MLNRRLLAKVFIWRLLSIPITVLLTYAYTGQIKASVVLTIIHTVVLTSGNYLYEKIWNAYLPSEIKNE